MPLRILITPPLVLLLFLSLIRPALSDGNYLSAPTANVTIGALATVLWDRKDNPFTQDNLTLLLVTGWPSTHVTTVSTLMTPSTNPGSWTWTPGSELAVGFGYNYVLQSGSAGDYGGQFAVEKAGATGDSPVTSSVGSSSTPVETSANSISSTPTSAASPSPSLSTGVSATSSSTPTNTQSSPSASSTNSDRKGDGSKPPIGAIVGGTIGGLAVLGFIGLGALYILRNSPKDGGSRGRLGVFSFTRKPTPPEYEPKPELADTSRPLPVEELEGEREGYANPAFRNHVVHELVG